VLNSTTFGAGHGGRLVVGGCWFPRLELLEAIALDLLSYGLAVVGICRSNELALSHNLAAILRRLEDERGTRITNIGVGSLTLEATTLLVACVIRTSKEMCKCASRTLHAKTDGAVFCTVEFLKALNAGRIIIPDEDKTAWL
jgi:predicted ATPase